MWNGQERRLPHTVYFSGTNRRRSSSPQRDSETAAPDFTPGTIYDTSSSSCSSDSSPSTDSSSSSGDYGGGGGSCDGGGSSGDW